MNFENIIELINNNQFEDAEKELKVILEKFKLTEEDESRANYLLGYIYSELKNKKENIYNAKCYLLKSMKSPFPIPQAYCLYADLEDDKNIAINYLKLGLSKFSGSGNILRELLKYLPVDEKETLIQQIIVEGHNDYFLLKDIISFLIENNKWDNINELVCRITSYNDLEDYENRYFQLLQCYSNLITNNTLELKRTLETFEYLINADVDNEFKYSHYLGAIYCAFLLKDTDKEIELFDKLPVNNSIGDLDDGPWCIIEVNFNKIYKIIFNHLELLFCNDADRKDKAKCLYSLYLFYSFDMYNNDRYNKRDINNVERYYRKVKTNLIGSILFNMKCGKKQHYSAYETYMNVLSNYDEVNRYNMFFSEITDNATDDVLISIHEDIIKQLKSDLIIEYTIFVAEVVDSIISRLWDSEMKDKYLLISDLISLIPMKYLKESYCIFECAYSCFEVENNKSEELYLYLVEKNPKNSSVHNNLGVLYEKRGEYSAAQYYYSEASKINQHEELYSRNLSRVNNVIDTNQQILNKVKQETAWFNGRLTMMCEKADLNGIIQCTHKDRSSILKVKSEKANELIEKMCKNSYIEKISTGNYQTPSTYKINPIIRMYLIDNKHRIEDNKEYEAMTEDLNLDTIELKGYTKELGLVIDKLANVELGTILKRDIKECVISLIIGQYKSSIVICGSIIEALLMNKLLENNVKSYDIRMLITGKSKMKKTNDMDLNELLEIASKEGLIKKEEYHLSQFLRSYRNIIHPACEIRKNFDINKQNAELMWSILKKLIYELI